MAIVLKDISLTYGSGGGWFAGGLIRRCRREKGDSQVVRALDNLSLRAEPGSIYGLLGPSGCGKTSVLSCCLGVTRPDSGSVLVFGRPPGTPLLGLPGAAVGFMPQSISLHSFFTPEELLSYYGRIFEVPNLKERVREMLDLVELNDGKVEKRRNDQLSGGQMRRISLACALIHRPPLIILDEPTVGVDPVLRKKIWETLRSLASSSSGATIVITTHYMEEAAQADKIGFVRSGRMLREGAPEEVMASLGTADLDQAFLRLCQNDADEMENRRMTSSAADSVGTTASSVGSAAGDSAPLIKTKLEEETFESDAHFLLGNREVRGRASFSALCIKNLTVLKRHGLFMAFQAVMPVITFLVFIACIGPPLKDLRLSVYNGEGGDCAGWVGPVCPLGEGLDKLGELIGGMSTPALLGEELSCSFLAELDREVFPTVSHWSSEEDATEAVRAGEADAAVFFSPDFSAALAARVLIGVTLETDSSNSSLSSSLSSVLSAGTLRVRLDATDATVASSVRSSLVRTVQSSLVRHAENCTALSEVARLLRRAGGLQLGTSVQEIVLREEEIPPTILSHDMLPGMMALILQMLAMALTSDLLIKEKESGLLVRDFACGVSLTLALVANLLCMVVVVVAQIGFSLVLLAVVSPQIGGGLMAALALLFLLCALCGMTLGFLLTAIFPTTEQVIQAGISLIFPTFVLSGVLWPSVSMPPVLQAIAVALPATVSCEVARSIVVNRTMEVPLLYVGYLMPVMWGLVFFLSCLVIIRMWGFKV